MRFLVVGAGAVGGYFGGRLLQAGRDVTFLVRPERAARMGKTGLAIRSQYGDVDLRSPPTVISGQIRECFDVVLLACKAYDLPSAIDAIGPAVSENTAVIPLLNGMRHLDDLDERIGARHVLGGLSLISARLEDSGRIVHLNDVHRIVFGDRDGANSPRTAAIAAAMDNVDFEVRVSKDIILEMWEKWVFLATLAGSTCLMRAAVGDMVAAGGTDLMAALFEECRSIAAAAGRDPRPEFLERALPRLYDVNSPMTASMLTDLERGGRTEGDHILGDLLRRRTTVPVPDHSILRIAYTAINAATNRSIREKTQGASTIDETSVK
jgi:2-dehydropantoate 2-reductase